MNDYISKPIDPASLYQKIQKWLGSKKFKNQYAPPVELSPPAEWAIDGLDITSALARVAGKKASLRRMLTSFVEDFVQVHEHIRTSIGLGQTNQALNAIHTLKGASGAIGATQLYGVCVALEVALKSSTGGDQALLSDLVNQHQQLIENLHVFLAKENRASEPQPKHIGMNKPMVLSKLDDLVGLLNQFNTASITFFTDHHTVFESIGQGDLLRQLETHINHYEFTQALSVALKLKQFFNEDA